MAKMFTDLTRHALNGATMGTRWSALFYAPPGFDPAPLQVALADAVDQVDRQMSTWKTDSDLNRLNAAEVDQWVKLPDALMAVLAAGLSIGKASDGAFDIAMGDAVTAWGFGEDEASPEHVREARLRVRKPAYELLELDRVSGCARKREPASFDLNGIAKGYGVDRLTAVARNVGILEGVFSIDGEVRAAGNQPDGKPWGIAIEAPVRGHRAAHSVIALSDAAVATSGDYRHWVNVGSQTLSHTMDPKRGMPLATSPASVTVVAEDCMTADAWATAMMVMGERQGMAMATRLGLSALFLSHDGGRDVGSGCFAQVLCDQT